MDYLTLIKIFGVLLLAHFSACEEINANNCKKSSDSTYLSEIHSIRVEPCPGAPDGPCELPRGSPANITIEFTPTEKITRRARHGYFWETSETTDLPFAGINPKACKNMRCPARKNKRTIYHTSLPIRKNLPAGTYDTKVKIYTGSKVHVCKVFKVKLV